MHTKFILLCLRMSCILGFCAAFSAAHADIYVIANPNIPVEQLSKQQIADLYLGRARTIQSGDYVTLFDQADEQPVRGQFFRLIADMSLTQVNAYWARLTFTGRQRPPQPQANDAKVIDAVSRTPRAIGYVSSAPPGNQVRVILHLHE